MSLSDCGLLPKWQLLVATTAFFNSIQNFVTVKLTKRVYNTVPPSTPGKTLIFFPNAFTALQARTFAAWTFISGVVRLYAAYHIHDKAIYDLALITYFLAFAHFVSEIFIFRTAKLSGAVISPVIVSTTSLIWMLGQYDFYVKR
ncbi:Erg28-like protein [Amylostereum chailletii]|nr:Erg28-like protein [Amylostereum chailletii]